MGGLHSRALGLQAIVQTPGKAQQLHRGGQREWKSYLTGHGGRRGPEVGVVKSRFGHPAGRQSSCHYQL